MNREDALKLSQEGIDELAEALANGKSEALLQYLETVSKFHHYSFGNCMLIAMQRPNATLVAGFHRWRGLGRYVKKGESGIAILAPLVYRKKAENNADANGEESPGEKAVRGFRVVHVFDVSQTEGEELPALAPISGDPGEMVAQAEAAIALHGIALEYEADLGGALGQSHGGVIKVLPDLDPPARFAVLIHELAHELLHRGERRAETTKRVRETEAEAVAFVVCRAIGLETKARSADYIQLYAGDKDLLMQSLEYIQRVAAQILSDLHACHEKQAAYAV